MTLDEALRNGAIVRGMDIRGLKVITRLNGEVVNEGTTDDLINDVGFKPATSIEEGVKKFVEWYRSYYVV